MNRSSAVTIIKRGLGFRQTQDTSIVSALQQAQRDLELGKTLPEWLVVYGEQIPFVAGTALVDLPTGFLRLHEDYPPYVVTSDNERYTVPRRRDDEAHEAYGGVAGAETTTNSRVFVLRGTKIELVPEPTLDGSLFLTYYGGAATLDTDVENEWLAHAANYLIGMAGMIVAGDLRDAGAMQKFTQMAKMGGQAYMSGVVDAELAGRPLVMGRNN